MSVTVVREDDQPTRHPWYRIPATVEIKEWRYPIREWSLEGFSVVGVDEPVSPEQTFPARLIFRFDGFSTVVDVTAEVVRADDQDGGLTCRFNDLSRQKVAVLRAVIDSYLLGEFVAMDDVIHVVRRDSPADLSSQKQPTAPTGAAQALRQAVRRCLLDGMSGTASNRPAPDLQNYCCSQVFRAWIWAAAVVSPFSTPR